MKRSREQGYSLTEVLIALAITGIVATVIMGLFISQNRAHVAQENVTDMQQNVRAGLGFMTREIRMAGFDPNVLEVDGTNTFGFFPSGTSPELASISFSYSRNDDQTLDNDEQITYFLNGTTLTRRTPTANPSIFDDATIADGIEALAFAYAYDADGDGELDMDGSGNVIFAIVGSLGDGTFGSANWYDLSGSDTGTSAQAEDIRAVRLWLLARTDASDQDYTNTQSYTVGTQVITPNDKRRRRLLDTAIRCRNMGL